MNILSGLICQPHRVTSYLRKIHVLNSTMSKLAGQPLKTVIEKLKEFAPTTLSEKWDNTGVLIEPYTQRPIRKILLTNDLTEDVMDEACAASVDMIISYHPPIFAALKSVTQRTWKERIVSRCLESGITLYSPHTSWDAVQGGVNDWLAGALPQHTSAPVTEGEIPGTGCGRICNLASPVSLKNIVDSVKVRCDLDHVRVALAKDASMETKITTVALCAGSGASVLKGVPAQLFITGEMLHHDVLDAVHCGTSVILTNHSDSERGFLKVFQPKLIDMLNNQVEVLVSTNDKDPLNTV